jgi:predicted 3-demethylubiquinone-9 3-methyltransferase (glyoxalase superfamily)
MDGLEQWKHLLMQIAHGSEPTEQLVERIRAQIEQFRKQAKTADQTALKKWLHDKIGSISYQVVPSSDLEKLKRRAHALQAALEALER